MLVLHQLEHPDISPLRLLPIQSFRTSSFRVRVLCYRRLPPLTYQDCILAYCTSFIHQSCEVSFSKIIDLTETFKHICVIGKHRHFGANAIRKVIHIKQEKKRSQYRTLWYPTSDCHSFRKFISNSHVLKSVIQIRMYQFVNRAPEI